MPTSPASIEANGPATVTHNFKVNGQVLTGTEESPMVSRSISEGKVNENKICCKTTVNGNSIEHEETVSGDTIPTGKSRILWRI